MSSLGGSPGCRILSYQVAMETGSVAGECCCGCANVGAASRKGWGPCYAIEGGGGGAAREEMK